MFERIGGLASLFVKFFVGDLFDFAGLTFPNESHFITVVFEIFIQTLNAGIELSVFKPTGEGFVPTENLGEFFVPLESLGLIFPKFFRVVQGVVVDLFVFRHGLHMGIFRKVRRRREFSFF